jgi:hypothetical protein
LFAPWLDCINKVAPALALQDRLTIVGEGEGVQRRSFPIPKVSAKAIRAIATTAIISRTLEWPQPAMIDPRLLIRAH